MDISGIRRSNLMILVTRAGSIKTLAHQARVSENLISQYKGPKSMGSRFARKLERGMRLPADWMDTLHLSTEALADFMPGQVEALGILGELNTIQRELWFRDGHWLAKR